MADVDLQNVILNFQKPIAIFYTAQSSIRANVSKFKLEFPENSRAIVYKKNEKIGDIEGVCYYLLTNSTPIITASSSAIIYRVYEGQSVFFDTTKSIYDEEIFSHYSDTTYFTNTEQIGNSAHNLFISRYSPSYRTNEYSSSTWYSNYGTDGTPCCFGTPTTNPSTTKFYLGMNPNSTRINDWLNYFTNNTNHTYKLVEGWSSWVDSELQTMATIRDYHNHLNNCDLLEENKFVDMHPFFSNIFITEKLDQAQKYIEDGTPPDDAIVNESDEYGAPIPKPPTPPEPEGGDNDDLDSQEDTRIDPEESFLALKYVNHYYMTPSECSLFFDWFWRDMFDAMVDDMVGLVYNAFTGAYGNLAQYFLSCRKFSIDMSKFFNLDNSNPRIVLGRYDTAIRPTAVVDSEKEHMYPIGSYDTRNIMTYLDANDKPIYGAFLDYAPFTTLSLYLPFVGIVPLETNQIMGRTIAVKASVDVVGGTILYNIYIQQDGKQILVGAYEGQCAVEIPIALDNAFNNASNLFSNAVNATIGVLGKNPMAIAELGNSIYSQPVNTTSATTTNSTYHNPSKCAIIIQQTDASIPLNLGEKKGYLWNQRAVLGNLHGFTQCENADIREFTGPAPLKSEYDEIIELLNSGVIL